MKIPEFVNKNTHSKIECKNKEKYLLWDGFTNISFISLFFF